MNKVTLLFGILLVIAIGAAGYFYLQTQKDPGQALGPYTPSASENPTPVPSAAEVENANWKTYNFSPWNLTFKYPTSWFVEEGTNQIRIQNYPPRELGSGYTGEKGIYLLTVIKTTYNANTIENLKSLMPKNGDEVYYIGDPRTVAIKNEVESKINNYSLYSLERSYTDSSGVVQESFYYFLDGKDNVLEIRPGLDIPGGKAETDEILSTFKFTNK